MDVRDVSKISEGWMRWFVKELRTNFFGKGSDAAVVFTVMYNSDRNKRHFEYLNSIQPLSLEYWRGIEDTKEYVFSALDEMCAEHSPVGICIAFKNMVVVKDVFSDDYENNPENGLTIYHETMLPNVEPSVIWIPDINKGKGYKADGGIGWGRYYNRTTDFNKMLKSLKIAHSSDPSTWGGFDRYEDLLKATGGWRNGDEKDG